MKTINLDGIITPLITPLNSDFSLDIVALKKIIEHIIEGGVSAVFPLGTTGEFCSFSMTMQKQVITEVCAAVNGRIPVLVGISSPSLHDTYVLAEVAKNCQADALVATLPFYYRLSQEEVVDYYTTLANKVDLPLFLYNMPGQTKINIEIETVLTLSKHPNIVGLKDSSADMKYFADLATLFKNTDFTLYVGPEEKLAESLKLGAHGGVNGGSNLYPKLYVSLFKAFKEGDIARVEKIQMQILKLSRTVYNLTNNPNSYLQGLKAAMNINGLCEATLAIPLKELSGHLKIDLREKLTTLF